MVGSYCCVCRSPRFDVDPYGRLFIPCSPTGKIAVSDNAGNTVISFGQYGNTDSRGASGIPIAWPLSVAASDDYIYVNDCINARMVRVQMIYKVDNMPGLTEHNTENESGTEVLKRLSMVSTPNPFNPTSTISITMPSTGNIKLAVYNANGKFIGE
jgi:hypothetical protein